MVARGVRDPLAGARHRAGDREAAHDDARDDDAGEHDVADDGADELEQAVRHGAADIAAGLARARGGEDRLGRGGGVGVVERKQRECGEDDQGEPERHATGDRLLAVNEEGDSEGEERHRHERGGHAEREGEEVAQGARDHGRRGDEDRGEKREGENDQDNADYVAAQGARKRRGGRALGTPLAAGLAPLLCCV